MISRTKCGHKSSYHRRDLRLCSVRRLFLLTESVFCTSLYWSGFPRWRLKFKLDGFPIPRWITTLDLSQHQTFFIAISSSPKIRVWKLVRGRKLCTFHFMSACFSSNTMLRFVLATSHVKRNLGVSSHAKDESSIGSLNTKAHAFSLKVSWRFL